MGMAIRDYYEGCPLQPLRVFSPQFEDDEFPVETLFRAVPDMSGLEREALRLCRGRVLDVGAGAGCHSLALQSAGQTVTAVDISPHSVETMRRRGVRDVRLADFFADEVGGPYDTLLFLMNGLGLAGTLAALPRLLERCAVLLAPGGQILADSSDLCYLFEDELWRGGLRHALRLRRRPSVRLALCRCRHALPRGPQCRFPVPGGLYRAAL